MRFVADILAAFAPTVILVSSEASRATIGAVPAFLQRCLAA